MHSYGFILRQCCCLVPSEKQEKGLREELTDWLVQSPFIYLLDYSPTAFCCSLFLFTPNLAPLWDSAIKIVSMPAAVFCSFSSCTIFFLKKLIYFWLCWVFSAACGLSVVMASGSYSLLCWAGFSLRWLLLLQSTGSRHLGFCSCGTWAQ